MATSMRTPKTPRTEQARSVLSPLPSAAAIATAKQPQQSKCPGMTSAAMDGENRHQTPTTTTATATAVHAKSQRRLSLRLSVDGQQLRRLSLRRRQSTRISSMTAAADLAVDGGDREAQSQPQSPAEAAIQDLDGGLDALMGRLAISHDIDQKDEDQSAISTGSETLVKRRDSAVGLQSRRGRSSQQVRRQSQGGAVSLHSPSSIHSHVTVGKSTVAKYGTTAVRVSASIAMSPRQEPTQTIAVSAQSAQLTQKQHSHRSISSWQFINVNRKTAIVHSQKHQQQPQQDHTGDLLDSDNNTTSLSIGDRFIPTMPLLPASSSAASASSSLLMDSSRLSDTLDLKRIMAHHADTHAHTITLPVGTGHGHNGNANPGNDVAGHSASTSSTAETDGADMLEAYTTSVASACGLAIDERILSFKGQPVKKSGRASSQAASITWARAGYQRPLKQPGSLHARRKIPTHAERVLDAPGIVDDFYLNVLDWSSRNQLAVALAESIYIWNAATGSVNELLPARPNPSHPPTTLRTDASALTWCPDGIHMAIHDSVGQMHIWNVEQAKRVRVIRDFIGHRASSIGWSVHASASVVSSGGSEGSVHLHDVRIRDSLTMDWHGHTGDVCGMKWNHSFSSYLATGGNDNLVNVWDCRSTVPVHQLREHRAAVKALSWCPWQSHTLVTGGGTDDGQILFWHTGSGTKTGGIETGSQVTGLLWSKHYREFISSHGFAENQLTLWKYPSLKPIVTIPNAHQSRILHMTMSPDGQTVCTGAADENLKFWKYEKILARSKIATTSGSNLKQSPDFGTVNNMR